MANSKRTLRHSQKKVLKHLALEGESYVNAISPKLRFTTTRTRNAIKRLNEHRLIWLSQGSKDVKSRAPKFYSLTPYGVVEAFISFLNDEETVQMVNKWTLHSPQYILNLKKFKEKRVLNELKNILLEMYPKIVKPWGRNLSHEGMNLSQLPRVKSHILDTTLFYQIFEWRADEVDGDFKHKFLEIIIQDPDFRKGWERWLSVKKFLLNTLEIRYNIIKEESKIS